MSDEFFCGPWGQGMTGRVYVTDHDAEEPEDFIVTLTSQVLLFSKCYPVVFHMSARGQSWICSQIAHFDIHIGVVAHDMNWMSDMSEISAWMFMYALISCQGPCNKQDFGCWDLVFTLIQAGWEGVHQLLTTFFFSVLRFFCSNIGGKLCTLLLSSKE